MKQSEKPLFCHFERSQNPQLFDNLLFVVFKDSSFYSE